MFSVDPEPREKSDSLFGNTSIGDSFFTTWINRPPDSKPTQPTKTRSPNQGTRLKKNGRDLAGPKSLSSYFSSSEELSRFPLFAMDCDTISRSEKRMLRDVFEELLWRIRTSFQRDHQDFLSQVKFYQDSPCNSRFALGIACDCLMRMSKNNEVLRHIASIIFQCTFSDYHPGKNLYNCKPWFCINLKSKKKDKGNGVALISKEQPYNLEGCQHENITNRDAIPWTPAGNQLFEIQEMENISFQQASMGRKAKIISDEVLCNEDASELWTRCCERLKFPPGAFIDHLVQKIGMIKLNDSMNIYSIVEKSSTISNSPQISGNAYAQLLRFRERVRKQKSDEKPAPSKKEKGNDKEKERSISQKQVKAWLSKKKNHPKACDLLNSRDLNGVRNSIIETSLKNSNDTKFQLLDKLLKSLSDEDIENPLFIKRIVSNANIVKKLSKMVN